MRAPDETEPDAVLEGGPLDGMLVRSDGDEQVIREWRGDRHTYLRTKEFGCGRDAKGTPLGDFPLYRHADLIKQPEPAAAV